MKYSILVILMVLSPFTTPLKAQEIKTYYYPELDVKKEKKDKDIPVVYSVKETGDLLQGVCKVYALNQLSYSIVNYVDGVREGHQKLYNKKGEMYLESTFVNGFEEGPGTFYYPNGQVKEKRHYEKGMLSGRFEYYDEKGNLTEEKGLDKGRYHGVRRKYLQGDTILDCTYENGGLVGRSYDATADTILISWHSGPQNGEFEVYYSKGVLKTKGKKSRGKKLGEWTYYFPDGGLEKVENYNKKGEHHGSFLHYYKNGTISEETNYKDGKIEGIKQSWNVNGILSQRANYINGQREGKEETYYPNGTLKSEYTYLEGVAQGPYTLYVETGKITESGRMENNDYVERIFYNEKGKVTRKERRTENGWEKF